MLMQYATLPLYRQCCTCRTTFLLTTILSRTAGGYGGTVFFDPMALQSKSKKLLKEAEILITEPAVLAQLYHHGLLKQLKWCQSTYAGVDPVFAMLSEKASHEGSDMPSFKLTRFAGVFGPPIAEWCLARIIAHERSFDSSRRDQEQKQWAGSKEVITQYRYLRDLTLVILGVGDIGLCIARAARAFGMTVVGYARSKRSAEGLSSCTTSLQGALQQADYLVNVLPSTKETRGLLSGDGLLPASIEPGGKCPVFLNVGRGDIIDEGSLIRALDRKYISTAILDVFDREPLPLDSLLWTRKDVIISPHVSGITQSEDVPRLFLDNYQCYIQGKPLKYVVDWNKGY